MSQTPLPLLSTVPEPDRRPPAAAPVAIADTGLHVDRIGKSFGTREVVRSVSLQLARGEVVGLLGPNGAGKTT